MQRKYFWFNLICLIVSVCLAAGLVFIYWRNANKYEITPSPGGFVFNSGTTHEAQLSVGENQIATSNRAIKEQDDNMAVSSTLEEATPNKALPKEFNLAVPFTSQAPEKNWDQPWQDACEEAALLMLDAYYKGYNLSPLFAKDEILKTIKWEEERGWGTSIPLEKVKEAAMEYLKISNFKIQNSKLVIVENPTVEDIKKSIANGNPVLVVTDGKVLPNPHYRNGGPVYHALIIKGYDEDEFITNDPGTQFGRDFKYKYSDLLNAVHDWNNGEVKSGRRVVMVLDL